MKKTKLLLALTCMFLVRSAYLRACQDPPCTLGRTIVCSVETKAFEASTLPSPAKLNLTLHNAAIGCTGPAPNVRVDSLTATALADGTPSISGFVPTPFVLPANTSLSGTMDIVFPPSPPSGPRTFRLDVAGVDLGSSQPFSTSCYAVVSIHSDIEIEELSGNCGFPAGTETQKQFRITNRSNAARQLAWKIRSQQTSTTSISAHRYDDASSETAVGLDGIVGGGQTAWLQGFQALGSPEIINSIGVAFGAQGASNGPAQGTPFGLGVWDDPTDDGNPADAVLVSFTLSTVGASNVDDVDIFPVPPVGVQGGFFVGVWLSNVPGEQPAAVDQSQASQGRAWLTGSSTAFDPNNLSSLQNDVGLIDLDFLTPGVFLLRANAGSDNDNFPIALAGTPIPAGDPSSSVYPTLSGTIVLEAGRGSVYDISIGTRSFPACHECSNNKFELEVTDLATGEVGYASSDYTVLPSTWNAPTWTPSLAQNYCVGTLSSCGAVMTIGSDGLPSVTNPGAGFGGSAFNIFAVNAPSQKPGLLLYGFNGPASIPFFCGQLCVAPPIGRTGILSSGGAPNSCSGSFVRDMNAFAAGNGGTTPHPLLSLPPTQVWCQWWARDAAQPCSAVLSDGLTYTVLP